MRIGIIDADLLGRTRHRFPNLACMKISAYHKEMGDEVTLITSYPSQQTSSARIKEYRQKYDKIYVSKVFVDTEVPYELLNLEITVYGGSGFFYADAEPLPPYIEHHMPDYNLYDEWVKEQKALGVPNIEFKYYELYSIGFTTRGCVRQCKFCINQHCTKVEKASDVKEFLDSDRRWICLLDDNFLAYENWKEILDELNATGKQFEFNQGLDIRSMNEEKAIALANSNLYMNNIYFAFDNIKEKDIITEKLKLWRTYYNKYTHMYVLCGYDENNLYDEEFWAKDIENTLERIRICIQYNIFPYIMRYQKYKLALDPYYGMYINLASWCNQKGTIVKYSLNEWANAMQKCDEERHGNKKLYSAKRHLMKYAGKHPEIAYEYFDLKHEEISEYKYERHTQVRNQTKKPQNETKYKILKPLKLINTIKKDNNILNNIDTNKLSYNIEIIDNVSEFKKNALKFGDSIVNLCGKNIRQIPSNSADLFIVNCKQETLYNIEKAVLKFSELCLKNNGNLFVLNIDVNSLTLTKEFIEQYTNLKFKETSKFNSWTSEGNKTIAYCSRFNNSIESRNIFTKNKIIENKTTLFTNIISKLTNKDNNIISFFELLSNFENTKELYTSRNWICFKKSSKDLTQSTINVINELLINKQQISLIEENNDTDNNDFINGVDVVNFNNKNIRNIPLSKVNSLILNCKDENLSEEEKAILSFSELCLTEKGSLYVFNIDLNSSNLAKEYVESNTNLSLKEMILFEVKGVDCKRCMIYCSRYDSMDNDKKIFGTNIKYTKNTLLKNIAQNTSDNKIILSFFENRKVIKNVVKSCKFQLKWFYFKKYNIAHTSSAIKTMNELLQNKTSKKQISLIDNEKKDIS